MIRTLLTALLSMLLVACGQSGDLYLPDKEAQAKSVVSGTPPPVAAAPAAPATPAAPTMPTPPPGFEDWDLDDWDFDDDE